jgi:hypothetical protein
MKTETTKVYFRYPEGEAKIIAESTQKEARASANATSVQMESTKNEIKAEMNAIKKATTNRLGQ